MSEEKKKLSYEELEAYTQQTASAAEQILRENQKLKQALGEMRMQMNYSDINLAFKVLEHKNMFPDDFVLKVVNKLVAVLTPTELEVEEAKKEE